WIERGKRLKDSLLAWRNPFIKRQRVTEIDHHSSDRTDVLLHSRGQHVGNRHSDWSAVICADPPRKLNELRGQPGRCRIALKDRLDAFRIHIAHIANLHNAARDRLIATSQRNKDTIAG